MFSSVNVHNHLQELDIQHEIFKVPEPAGSMLQAAAALGLEQSQMAVVEVFVIDDEPTLVVLPADRTVDAEKLKKVSGATEVRKASPEDISALTGFISQAIPPVGLKTAMPAYIDYYTLREDVVYTGSGEPTAILKIRSYDLVRATGGETVDLVVSEEETGG
jgi:prolyl-tRNA editing enzyme YbaK/EbsC (Cys-tRNA(Pro) deacylase)